MCQNCTLVTQLTDSIKITVRSSKKIFVNYGILVQNVQQVCTYLGASSSNGSMSTLHQPCGAHAVQRKSSRRGLGVRQNIKSVNVKGLLMSSMNVIAMVTVITDSSSHLHHPIPQPLPGPVLTPKYQAISPGGGWAKKNVGDP